MEEQEITYSFVIPHKNCPALLQRCVDSIPVRDDVQIIVVDDNSDDGKKPSLGERNNLDIILLESSQSKGAGRARNVGLTKAKGRWLLFPDSDDYYADGFLEVLDGYANDQLDVIYFNFKYRDGITGNELDSFINKDFERYDGSKESDETIKFHHNVPWTKMVNRNFAVRNNLWFEEVPNGNDMFFSMMCGYYSKNIKVEKTPLYIYIKNNGSITNGVITREGALCFVRHTLQQDYFYAHINHPEWKRFSIRTILYFVKKCGLSFFLYLIKNAPNLYSQRKSWVIPENLSKNNGSK